MKRYSIMKRVRVIRVQLEKKKRSTNANSSAIIDYYLGSAKLPSLHHFLFSRKKVFKICLPSIYIYKCVGSECPLRYISRSIHKHTHASTFSNSMGIFLQSNMKKIHEKKRRYYLLLPLFHTHFKSIFLFYSRKKSKK